MALNLGELKQKLGVLRTRLDALSETYGYDVQCARQAALEEKIGQPGFWDDAERARSVVADLSTVKGMNTDMRALIQRVSDAEELLALALEEADEDMAAELEREVRAAGEMLEQAEIAVVLDGPYDEDDAFLSVHAGAGGTDAADWAEILGRMYLRWCEEHGYRAQIVDRVAGEEAGVRQVTLNVKGPRAYGYLKAEVGVHRLVRISPFDAKKRRHTSFAAVDVTPDAKQEVDIEVQESDLKIDTYRAGGAGGQHVNVTDSAVRITHLPTGIVVQCQNERSQHSNRAMAMKMLKARLLAIEEQKREESIRRAYDEKGDIAWGNQIRSYVLQPYTMVKDHRTGRETGNVNAVLDGAIMPFIDAYLRQRHGEEG